MFAVPVIELNGALFWGAQRRFQPVGQVRRIATVDHDVYVPCKRAVGIQKLWSQRGVPFDHLRDESPDRQVVAPVHDDVTTANRLSQRGVKPDIHRRSSQGVRRCGPHGAGSTLTVIVSVVWQ